MGNIYEKFNKNYLLIYLFIIWSAANTFQVFFFYILSPKEKNVLLHLSSSYSDVFCFIENESNEFYKQTNFVKLTRTDWEHQFYFNPMEFRVEQKITEAQNTPVCVLLRERLKKEAKRSLGFLFG